MAKGVETMWILQKTKNIKNILQMFLTPLPVTTTLQYNDTEFLHGTPPQKSRPVKAGRLLLFTISYCGKKMISTILRSDRLGAATGIGGAGLLALNVSWSGIGWILFLVSNFLWIQYGWKNRMRSLVIMQLGFTVTTLVGIWRWLV